MSSDLRDRWLVSVRQQLGNTEVERLLAEGSTLSMDEAIALAAVAPVGPAPREPSTDVSVLGTLTPRQLEVAVLVGHGLTNRQIAERLVVTQRAAAAHVEHILNKLGVGSRIQIAVWTSERGLLAKHPD